MNIQPRILFLLHLPPPVHGSSMVGFHIRESIVVNKAFDCSYINLLASKRLEEEGKINVRKVFDFISTCVNLFKSLIKKRPRLCYLALSTTGVAFYRDLVLVTLLKLFRIKLIYHLHNKGIGLLQHKILNKICYRYLFKNSDVIILSQLLYADIQLFVPESKIHICPNGIPVLPNIDLNAINEKRIAKTVPVILFLSNLIKEKGVYVLLEACKILIEKQISFITYFIGAPNDISEDSFNTFILTNNLQKNVFYVGRKYNEEKNDYFKQANVFVFPTYYRNETFGIVNIEAMQFGLPIISTNEGGIPDIIEDSFNGFIIPKKDPKILADKIAYLIGDLNKCVEMGTNGRAIFEARYTLEKFENKLLQILHEVLIKEQNTLSIVLNASKTQSLSYEI